MSSSRRTSSTKNSPPISRRFREARVAIRRGTTQAAQWIVRKSPSAKKIVGAGLLAGLLVGGMQGRRTYSTYIREHAQEFKQLESVLRPTDVQRARQLSDRPIDELVRNAVTTRLRLEREAKEDFEARRREMPQEIVLRPPFSQEGMVDQLARMTPSKAEKFLRDQILFRDIEQKSPERQAEFKQLLARANEARAAYSSFVSGAPARGKERALRAGAKRGYQSGGWVALPVLLYAAFLSYRRRASPKK